MRAFVVACLLASLLSGAGCSTSRRGQPAADRNDENDETFHEVATRLAEEFNARDPSAEFEDNLKTGKIVFYMEGSPGQGYRIPGVPSHLVLVLRSDERVMTLLVLRTEPAPMFFSSATWNAARNFMERYNAIAFEHFRQVATAEDGESGEF